MNELRLGQKWQEVDPRFPDAPLRQIVEISSPFAMDKFGGGKIEGVRNVVLLNLATNRSTTAKTHTNKGAPRFNGKRGGYRLIHEPVGA